MLDLSNPATFRDLSKPMGAQSAKRKQMFIQRYEDMENNEEEGTLGHIFVIFTVLFQSTYKKKITDFFVLRCFFLLFNRLVSTLSLLYPLLISHHCSVLPCQGGAIFTHFPDTSGKATNTGKCKNMTANKHKIKCCGLKVIDLLLTY